MFAMRWAKVAEQKSTLSPRLYRFFAVSRWNPIVQDTMQGVYMRPDSGEMTSEKTQTTVSCNIRLPPRATFLVAGQKIVGVRQRILVALSGTVGVWSPKTRCLGRP
ncbi:hypothetical protein WG66_007796 [Moniliophthora roreri]|nr:hypothetical protein WG66_007796 [Moniliophthora roreri]